MTVYHDSNWAAGALSGSLDGWLATTAGNYSGTASALAISTSTVLATGTLLRPTSENVTSEEIDIFFTAFSSSSIGAVFRADGSGNFYYCYINQATGTLFIGKVSGGTLTNIVLGTNGNAPVVAGTKYVLKASILPVGTTGSTINLSLLNASGTTNPVFGTQIGVTITATNDTTSGLQLATQSTGGQSGMSAGNASGSAASVQRLTTQSVTSAANVFADDANILYSGRWAKTGSGTTAKATTITTGCQIDAAITGTSTCAIKADVSNIALSSYPEISYQIDGGGWTRAAFDASGSIPIAFPSFNGNTTSVANTHVLSIVTDGIYEGLGGSQGTLDQWNSQQAAFVFAGLALDSGGSTLPLANPPNFIEFGADSLGATHNLISAGAAANQTQMAGHVGFCYSVAKALGLRAVIAGFGRQGLVNNSAGNSGLAAGNVPIALSTFPYVYAGFPYSPTVKPLVFVSEYGTNDVGITSSAAFQAGYTSYLMMIRAAYPNALIECLILPYFSSFVSAITAAVASLNDARILIKNYSSGSVISVAAGDYNSDGVHINVQGSNKLAAKLSLDIQADLAAQGIVYGPYQRKFSPGFQ